MAYLCPSCDHPTRYAAFSGGREFYCPGCGNQGMYPDDAEGLPRATLLRTPEGVEELRRRMHEHLAAREAADI